MKTKTKILSVLMTVAVLLSSLVLVFPTFAEGEEPAAPTSKWSENAATGYAGGTGTEDDPYIISTAEQLAYMAVDAVILSAEDNGKYYKLADAEGNPVEIDLSAHLWDTPIGTYYGTENSDNRFQGIFVGNGSTIKGMIVRDKLVANKGEYTALFGGTTNSLSNFTLYADIEASINICRKETTVSALVGHASGSTTISNVDVFANMNITQITNSQSLIAGMVGCAHGCTITDSSMNGELNLTVGANDAGAARQPLVGGVVCFPSKNLTATRVVNNMDITVTRGAANGYIGGIVACAGKAAEAGKVTLTGCVNNGNLTSIATTAAGTGTHNLRMGGMLGGTGRSVSGSAEQEVEIVGCINTGILKGKFDGANIGNIGTSGGGFGHVLGQTESTFTISNCFGVSYGAFGNHNDHMHHFEGNSASSVKDINGNALSTTNNGYGISPDSDYVMEVGICEKDLDNGYVLVGVSKNALQTFQTAGYELALTYGSQIITDYAEFAPQTGTGIAYAFIFTDEDAVPSLTLSKTIAGKTYTYKAEQGFTWTTMTDKLATDLAVDGEGNYIIATAEDLAALANSANRFRGTSDTKGKTFVITADIDLGAYEWKPIGLSHNCGAASYFQGILDGQGYTISNLRLTDDEYNYSQALFGYLGQTDSGIMNLNIDNVDIDVVNLDKTNIIPGANVLVGAMYNGTIDNVHVTGMNLVADEIATDSARSNYYGGLVGYGSKGTITNSSVEGTMSIVANGATFAGGIVARANTMAISNCESNVDIALSATVPAVATKNLVYVFVGGIAGYVYANNDQSNNTVDNCVVNGNLNVSVDSEADAITFDYVGVGGVVGGASSNSGTAAAGSGNLAITNTITAGEIVLNDNSGATSASIGAFIGNDTFSPAATVSVTNSIGLTCAAAIGNLNITATVERTVANNVVGDLNLTTLEGARVRISPDALENSGLRFDSKLDYDVYTALKNAGCTVTVGTAITTADNLAAVNGDWAALTEDVASGKLTVDATVVSAGADYNFTGAIKNLKVANYTTDFVACAYITVTIPVTTDDGEGGTVTTYVTTTIYSASETTRNVAQVAAAALADVNGNYTAGQLAILNAYVA